MGNDIVICKLVIFFKIWECDMDIIFKCDVCVLKYLIEIELGLEIVDINYSVWVWFMRLMLMVLRVV